MQNGISLPDLAQLVDEIKCIFPSSPASYPCHIVLLLLYEWKKVLDFFNCFFLNSSTKHLYCGSIYTINHKTVICTTIQPSEQYIIYQNTSNTPLLHYDHEQPIQMFGSNILLINTYSAKKEGGKIYFPLCPFLESFLGANSLNWNWNYTELWWESAK